MSRATLHFAVAFLLGAAAVLGFAPFQLFPLPILALAALAWLWRQASPRRAASLGFAFGALKLHRVEAACVPTNHASRRVLEKAGFRHEGLARAYLKINGAWADHLLFGVIRDEFVPGPIVSSSYLRDSL